MLKAETGAFFGAGLGLLALGGAAPKCLRRLRASIVPPSFFLVVVAAGVEVSQSSESDDEEETYAEYSRRLLFGGAGLACDRAP